MGDEDRLRHAPHLSRSDGYHHRGLGRYLRVDGGGDRRGVARLKDSRGRSGCRYHLYGQRPRAQALSRRSGRCRHSLSPGRGELDRSFRRVGRDESGHVCRRLGSLEDAGTIRLRCHGALKTQKHGSHRVRPCLSGHRYRRTLLGWTQIGKDPGEEFSLCGVAGRCPAHGKTQNRSGQEDQGAGHLSGLLQLYP